MPKNFEKGDPRINRKGRPVGSGLSPLRQQVRNYLEAGDTPRLQALLGCLYTAATDSKPDTRAAALLLEYGYGKPTTELKIGGPIKTEKVDPSPAEIDAILAKHGYVKAPKG